MTTNIVIGGLPHPNPSPGGKGLVPLPSGEGLRVRETYLRPHEHLRLLHPAADRHVTACSGAVPAWPERMAATAGGAFAAGRVPDDPGLSLAARCEPRDDGVERRNAARAIFLADPGAHPDELDEHAGRDERHAAVR